MITHSPQCEHSLNTPRSDAEHAACFLLTPCSNSWFLYLQEHLDVAGLSEDDEAEMRLLFLSLEARSKDINQWAEDFETYVTRSVSQRLWHVCTYILQRSVLSVRLVKLNKAIFLLFCHFFSPLYMYAVYFNSAESHMPLFFFHRITTDCMRWTAASSISNCMLVTWSPSEERWPSSTASWCPSR